VTLLNTIAQKKEWNKFLKYKSSIVSSDSFIKELQNYIDEEKYSDVYGRIQKGDRFPTPRKSVISKLSSEKKRNVYSYPYDENMAMKLLTYEMTRKYNYIFCDNLYSFRPGRSAKDAFKKLVRHPGIERMYSYKVDIHNYFNSVPISQMLPILREVLQDDLELFNFLSGLLCETEVIIEKSIIVEEKGIMAGTPMATFYANLYLKDLDEYFENKGVIYARYSDDIIVFAESREMVEKYAEYIKKQLHEKGLTVNQSKECFNNPGEAWTFLGFKYEKGIIDIAPATVKKLKKKMKRKTDSLRRWHMRNHIGGEKAAKAFIRIFNRKLFEHPENNDLSWSYWFFSVINTSKSLKEIDHYSQECIRYLVSGKRTKARYNVRYEDLKELGYRSLVHEYYSAMHMKI
jgi:retron-type reverse transcriptase